MSFVIPMYSTDRDWFVRMYTQYDFVIFSSGTHSSEEIPERGRESQPLAIPPRDSADHRESDHSFCQ